MGKKRVEEERREREEIKMKKCKAKQRREGNAFVMGSGDPMEGNEQR